VYYLYKVVLRLQTLCSILCCVVVGADMVLCTSYETGCLLPSRIFCLARDAQHLSSGQEVGFGSGLKVIQDNATQLLNNK